MIYLRRLKNSHGGVITTTTECLSYMIPAAYSPTLADARQVGVEAASGLVPLIFVQVGEASLQSCHLILCIIDLLLGRGGSFWYRCRTDTLDLQLALAIIDAASVVVCLWDAHHLILLILLRAHLHVRRSLSEALLDGLPRIRLLPLLLWVEEFAIFRGSC